MAGGSNGSDGHLHDSGDDIFEKPASIFLSALHILKEALRRGGLGEASFSRTGTANGNDGYGWSVPWHAAFVKEVGPGRVWGFGTTSRQEILKAGDRNRPKQESDLEALRSVRKKAGGLPWSYS